MSNRNKTPRVAKPAPVSARSLADALASENLVVVDSGALHTITTALYAALGYLTQAAPGSPLPRLVQDGTEALGRLTKPLAHGQLLNVLSRAEGLKDWNAKAAQLEQALPQDILLDGTRDCQMAETVEDDRVWVTVGNIAVYLKRTHEGVIVDLFPLGVEDGGSLATAGALFSDAELALRDSGLGWAIYCAAEAEQGAGWWHNEQGWVEQEDECTVFTEADKARARMPVARGPVTWVQLDAPAPAALPPTDAQLRAAAQTAYEMYSLDDGLTVVDANAWDTDGPDHLLRVVYAVAEGPEDESVKLSFHVQFHPGTANVEEAYCYYMSTGALCGGM